MHSPRCVKSRVATRPGFHGMSRICAMLSLVPSRQAPGCQMSRISRYSQNDKYNDNNNSNNSYNRPCKYTCRYLIIAKLQMYRVQWPATRLHQNAPNHIQNSKNFSRGDTSGPPSAGGFTPRPSPRLGKWKGGNASKMFTQCRHCTQGNCIKFYETRITLNYTHASCLCCVWRMRYIWLLNYYYCYY